ncbi:hypothetical protein HAX54_037573 [Datura stramonium]|uniref:Uncharacterized protein n=1 Tax=Datura stramonium TaxID=4076 RepID=A0ABS8VIE3_DATST|nr:hypothetical protein [Datura stramonium]
MCKDDLPRLRQHYGGAYNRSCRVLHIEVRGIIDWVRVILDISTKKGRSWKFMFPQQYKGYLAKRVWFGCLACVKLPLLIFTTLYPELILGGMVTQWLLVPKRWKTFELVDFNTKGISSGLLQCRRVRQAHKGIMSKILAMKDNDGEEALAGETVSFLPIATNGYRLEGTNGLIRPKSNEQFQSPGSSRAQFSFDYLRMSGRPPRD